VLKRSSPTEEPLTSLDRKTELLHFSVWIWPIFPRPVPPAAFADRTGRSRVALHVALEPSAEFGGEPVGGPSLSSDRNYHHAIVCVDVTHDPIAELSRSEIGLHEEAALEGLGSAVVGFEVSDEILVVLTGLAEIVVDPVNCHFNFLQGERIVWGESPALLHYHTY
jgi:hypothetical protein